MCTFEFKAELTALSMKVKLLYFLLTFNSSNRKFLFPGPEEDDQVLFYDELSHTG